MWRLKPDGPLAGKLVRFDDASGTTIFQGARVIDGTGAAPVAADVIVRGQRVVRLGTATAEELAGATLVDCRGTTIVPGLIDAHVHFNGEIASDPYRRYLWPDDRVRTIRAALCALAFLEAGFTTVRDCGITGAGYALRYAINSEMIVGPRILTAGPGISPTGGQGDWIVLPLDLVRELRPVGLLADGEDGVRLAVREVARQGADLIKVRVSHSQLGVKSEWPPVPVYTVEEIRAAVEEAHGRRLMVAAHAHGVESIRRAVAAGVDTIEHGIVLPGEDPEPVLARMAEQGTILVPTLNVYYHTVHTYRNYGLSDLGVQRGQQLLDGSPALIAAARKHGVRIAAGTDTSSRGGVGDNAREMVLLASMGLTPMEALVAATKVAAEALGAERELGTLEPGKLADLLVLERDPLADLESLLDRANIRIIAKAVEPVSRKWER
ncbi:MAG: amidohydrolase family protein [Chloroflexi bacterium]|nr:amidohydrolase family protein [Chloroflexota bacterium]